MSEENVEVVRQAYAAWERGDIQAIVHLCDPEIVIVQPPEVPDSKSYQGHQGVIATFEDWPKQWDEFEARLGEVIDVDERHVVSVCSQSLGAREMRLDLEAFFLHTLERGKHVRLDMFLTRKEALEAAGLSE
jgi:ketosteroid isomerase-like protein